MKNPLVSVILPTYNRVKYIERAIKSVLAQTYKNIELIIVNDGSTDGTYDKLNELAKNNHKIVVLNNEQNLGLTKTLNKGIALAKGKYIARIDDDDYWADVKKIEKQAEFLEQNNDYALVGGGLIKVDENGSENIRYLFPEKDEEIREIILMDNAFAHPTVMFRRGIFEKVGRYDENFDGLEDRDLWLKMGKESKFYNFQEFFVFYTIHKKDNPSYVERTYGAWRQLKVNIKLRLKYKKFYPHFLKSLFICGASYFYSYLPFRKKLWPLFFKLRILILGQPPYKYFKNYRGKKNSKMKPVRGRDRVCVYGRKNN